MNLVTDAWLPVKRESGRTDVVAPWQLTEIDDPITAFNAPRPDFDAALWQFIIGLLQTCAPPADHDAWLKWLEDPPSPAELQTKLADKYLHAFEVQSKHGSFMQDFEPLAGDNRGIAQLLIDAPGDNTLKENKDHFVKRDSVSKLCHSCAVLALFTLQTNAPSGGAGHRVSLRGGGPLTTLVIFDDTEPPSKCRLWSDVWLNVFDSQACPENISGKSAAHDIFPWLAKTRISKRDELTTPMDAHVLQAYWGMPRRIRIKWDEASSERCDLCLTNTNKLVTSYETKAHGINYKGGWQHPLSPYYVKKEEQLPLHLQQGGTSYKDWLGLVADMQGQSLTAQVVSLYKDKRKLTKEQFRLYTFGYDMDNMKARCWYETKFPLFTIDNANFSTDVQNLTAAAEECVHTLLGCIKEAWFPRAKKKPSGDTSFLKKEFYQQTQGSFYALARRYADGKDEDNGAVWHQTLCKVALAMFDRQAIGENFVYGDPKAIVKARNKLAGKLNSIKKKLRA
ncbi:MAG: type I-E CRISPR-associated protein Cse1/CasA [Pseudomonadota bacterium]|nr:type I-E CRISPR-associated protein Cse1/CasA [Pseudomonadota bacterium]